MKNPDRLLKKLRKSINKNIRYIIKDQPSYIISPIPKKYLPSESPLRLLYNEAYYSHYAGLSYSTLSLCNVIIERLTKIFYKYFKPNGRSNKWVNIISELKTFFEQSSLKDKKELIILMEDFDYYRKNIRNLLLHGKVEEYLRSTLIEYEAINVKTLSKEKIKLKYNDNLNEGKKSEILDQRMTLDSQNLLILISIVFRKYHKYILDEL